MSKFEIPAGVEVRMLEIPESHLHFIEASWVKSPLSPATRICPCCPDCKELSPARGAAAGCRTCAASEVLRA